MSAEKLTAATSTYSIQYSDTVSHATRTRSPTPQARSDERLSLLEAVNDDQIWQASRSRYDLSEPPILPVPRPLSMHHRPSEAALRAWWNTPRGSHAAGRYSNTQDEERERHREPTPGNTFLDNCDWPPLQDPNAAMSSITRAPTPPPFTVTTTMESSDDEARSRRGHEDRENSYGPYGLPPFLPRDSIDSDTDGDASETSIRHRILRLQNSLRRPRPVRRSTPGEIGRETTVDDDEEDEVLEPNSRFFMPENECKITLHFDPPV